MKNIPIHFHDDSHDSDGNISSYQWDFDDGKSSNEENPTHSFSEDGIYKISLTISDDDGVYDSFSKSIRIGEQKKPFNIVQGVSLFEIIIVIFILIMVIFVIIVSKKYS